MRQAEADGGVQRGTVGTRLAAGNDSLARVRVRCLSAGAVRSAVSLPTHRDGVRAAGATAFKQALGLLGRFRNGTAQGPRTQGECADGGSRAATPIITARGS
jgi:hypothetical protein